MPTRRLLALALITLAAQPAPGLPAGWRLTVTIGVARATPGETPRETLARADRALYEGKAQGRDRVVAVA
ncbi:MAG: diguanylate cyclase [Pseudomonadota bacterium]